MFLIYHMTSHEHAFKGLWLNGLKSFKVSHYLAKFIGQRPWVSSDTAAKMFFVTLQDPLIKRSDFLRKGTSHYILPPCQN